MQKLDEESCVVIEEEEEEDCVLVKVESGMYWLHNYVYDNIELLMFIATSSNMTTLPRKRW